MVGCQSGDQADELNGDSVQSATDKVPSKLLRPVVVGEEEAAEIRSPAIAKALNKSAAPAWQHEIRVADATYIAPHFSNFSLPDGAHLIVRSGDGQRSRTYMGQGKLVPGERGFWAMHMPGEVATIELYSDVAVPAGAIVIDRYARGTAAYNDFELPEYGDELGEKAICGADDSEWAKCYESSESAAYNKARAVARLMINGTGACTGWLIGSEGHLMTNEHCIGSASAAANTDYEFMAEGTCGTNCATWGGCPGVVEADTASLIQLDSALDYALVKLPVNLTGTYGYLQLRPGGGSVGEQIYIPQHPQAWGKRIAMMDGNQVAHIDTLNAAPCSGGPGDVGYNADTQGGSSGSPVLGYSDNLVVALHHCAYCPNRGVPVDPIISDLGNNLPADALGGGG
ncbi:MAG: serine protease, partial [Myxococcota bacterium]